MSIGPRSPRRFITVRSLILGAAMSLLIGLHAPYWSVYLMSSRMYADYHTGGAAFWAFLLLIVFNLVLGKLWRPLALRAEELMTITAMMFISGSIASSGLLAHFVPLISRAYYGDVTGAWELRIWPNLQDWLSPMDPDAGRIAIQQYWEGVGPDAPIPWHVWRGPILIWGVLLGALFAGMTAIMAVMRKQWVDYEHLSFPIAQVPAAICTAAEDPWGEGSIFRSKAFWAGLGLTFLAVSLAGIRYYWTGTLTPLRLSESTDAFGPVTLRFILHPVLVGLVFLIPNRVAFSVWFLTLIAWGVLSFQQAYGMTMDVWMLYGSDTPELQFVAMGAILAFVVSSLWVARGHLGRALKCALGLGETEYDTDEPTSYRAAFIVIVLSSVVVVGWYVRTGMRWPVALLLLVLILAVHFAMARVIAQIGLPATAAPVLPSTFIGGLLGGANLTPTDSAVLGSQIWSANMRNSPMAGAAHSMRLVERRRGGLMWALLLALAITYVSGFLTSIWVSYRHGALNMDTWFYITSPSVAWHWSSGLVASTATFNWPGLTFTAVGAAGMTALFVAQRMLFWWPIHPVGFLISNAHMTHVWWFSVFAAWLIKALTVMLGGQSAFRSGRRFCIGMVMGYILAGGMWAILDTITGTTGNQLFYL